MIRSTVTDPITKVRLDITYLAGASGGVIRIDGRCVGEVSFVDSRALDQFVALLHLLARSPC